MQFRNYTPRSTIRHWHLVRRAELRYIVPELRRAHVIVNSFLPYELPIMKGRVEKHLQPVIEECADVPERQDACERAMRVRDLFTQLPAVRDEGIVPQRSLLREFIGGSAYRY
jgi:uridine kinase